MILFHELTCKYFQNPQAGVSSRRSSRRTRIPRRFPKERGRENKSHVREPGPVRLFPEIQRCLGRQLQDLGHYLLREPGKSQGLCPQDAHGADGDDGAGQPDAHGAHALSGLQPLRGDLATAPNYPSISQHSAQGWRLLYVPGASVQIARWRGWRLKPQEPQRSRSRSISLT